MDKGKSYVEDATGLIELGHELCEHDRDHDHDHDHERPLVGSIKRDFRSINVTSIEGRKTQKQLRRFPFTGEMRYKSRLTRYAVKTDEKHCSFGNWRAGRWP